MNKALMMATAEDGVAARSGLTVREAARCARLPGSQRRSDFRAGRLAAKRAAVGFGARCGSGHYEVASDADGAPRLFILDDFGYERELRAELSISHRDGRAAAVVAPAGIRVGIDLERPGSVPLSSIRYFLTPAEQRLVQRVDPTLLWSLKEAAWKALGLGRSVPFADLELRADDSGRFLGVTLRGVFMPARARVDRPWPCFRLVTLWMRGGVA